MPGENKDGAFEPPPNPYPTASNAPTPLGTLSTLPRELRDQIYGHVHNEVYHISNSSHVSNLKWRSLGQYGYELPMLKLSKAIRQEFLAALFDKAVFMVDNVGCTCGTAWKRKQIPFIDQILNVVYSVFLIHPNDMPERIAKPLEFFTGTEVLRNSCSIKPYFQSPMSVVQSPLMIAMKGLTGFKIVTLKLTAHASWVDGQFRDVTDAFRSGLEPSLGPSIIRKDWDYGFVSELTFRPRDYIANRNKAKTVSSNLGDEENQSLPQVGNS